MHQFHHVVKSFDEDQQMSEFVFHYHYPIKQTAPKQTKLQMNCLQLIKLWILFQRLFVDQ
jgi:hypothetical protein